MLSVLMVGTEMSWRGGENQICYLVRGLLQKGCDVHLAYPRKSLAVEKMKGLCSVLELPSRSGRDWRNILVLHRYCLREKIDIIDANSSAAHNLACYLKFLSPGLRTVVHRRVDDQPQRTLLFDKYRSAYIDAYVAISDCIKEVLVEHGVSREKISTVKSAVEPSRYVGLEKLECREQLCLEWELDPTAILVGNASALTKQKGYPDFIQVIAQLRAAGRNVCGLIAGDGPLREELEQLAASLGVMDHLVFLGHINRVPEFLAGLDVFLFPSRNEGLGTILLDALLARTPIVATRVGGIGEVVVNQKTGLLCEPGDVDGMSRCIEVLLDEEELRNIFAQQGVQHVVAEFGLSQMIDGNLQIYKNLELPR